MTDKELRKLSRLELLELLLEASRENEKLKEKIVKLRQENKAAESIENLFAATKQANSLLEYANTLTDALMKTNNGTATVQREKTKALNAGAQVGQPVISDRSLYWRIMNVYAKNNEALDILPEDIRNDVRERIRGIRESRK